MSISNDEYEKNNIDKNTQQIIKNYKLVEDENKSLKIVVEDLKKQIKELKKNKNNNGIINEKDMKIQNLEEQIKEYEKKCDDIIMGKSMEEKDKQIQILINEINSIRKNILNSITYNNRITNFDEFIKNIEKINELNNEIIEPGIQDAFTKLNELIQIYKQNDKNIINKLKENK